MASRDSDGGSDGGDHSVMDHQIQEVSYWDKKMIELARLLKKSQF